MIELQLRLLGTELLGLRLGRSGVEQGDEWASDEERSELWWRGYVDGRFDRADAEEGDDEDDEDGRVVWIDGLPFTPEQAFQIIANAQEAGEDEEWDFTEGDLDEEWAGLEVDVDE